MNNANARSIVLTNCVALITSDLSVPYLRAHIETTKALSESMPKDTPFTEIVREAMSRHPYPVFFVEKNVKIRLLKTEPAQDIVLTQQDIQKLNDDQIELPVVAEEKIMALLLWTVFQIE